MNLGWMDERQRGWEGATKGEGQAIDAGLTAKRPSAVPGAKQAEGTKSESQPSAGGTIWANWMKKRKEKQKKGKNQATSDES
jgi:hypothetical protein